MQWLRAAVFPERFVFMSEPDHLWLRPMPNLMADRTPAAFPFFYIEPAKKDFKHITEKFTGPLTLRQAESIVPMGEDPYDCRSDAFHLMLPSPCSAGGKAQNPSAWSNLRVLPG